ncbi:MAG: hypothetical protein ACYC6W_11000 [Nitrosotalea sp.]
MHNKETITSMSKVLNYFTLFSSIGSIVGALIYGTWMLHTNISNTEKRIALIENNNIIVEKQFVEMEHTLVRQENKIDKIYYLMLQGAKNANFN